jgi:hypothetical protein
MAREEINIGGQANDGTGDSIREAFDKANRNFAELYEGGVDLAPLENRVGELENSVSGLENSVNDLDTRLTTATTSIDSLSISVEDLSTGISEKYFPVVNNSGVITGISNYSNSNSFNYANFEPNAFSLSAGPTGIPDLPQTFQPFYSEGQDILLSDVCIKNGDISTLYKGTYTVETPVGSMVPEEIVNVSPTFPMIAGYTYILEIYLYHRQGNINDLYTNVGVKLINGGSFIVSSYYMNTLQSLKFAPIGDAYSSVPELSSVSTFSSTRINSSPVTSPNFTIETTLSGSGIRNVTSNQIAEYGYRLLVIKK